MSDSMKFGPEWLRNMSNDIGNLSSTSSSTLMGSSGGGGGSGGGSNHLNNINTINNSNNSRFPQAEFRYGREEMLSLHDKNIKLPELLPKYQKLFLEKMQCPLALLPPSSDEEVPRGLSAIGSLSSERSGALGLAVTSSSSGLLGSISSLSGISSRGTRGSSIDRGRGTRPRGLYHSSLGNYQRSAMFDEERGLTGRSERAWPERNGTTTADPEWIPSSTTNPSPRKEFSSLRSGTAGESWRRSRVEDDETGTNVNSEGWRTSAVRSTSWRGGENEGGTAFPNEMSGPSPVRLERSKSSNAGLGLNNRDPDSLPTATNLYRRFGPGSNNNSWDEDNLPEWAMDDPIEGGGTFDASGAFLGVDDKHPGSHTDRSSVNEHRNTEMLREERENSQDESTEGKHGGSRTQSTSSDESSARRSPDESDKIKADAPHSSSVKEILIDKPPKNDDNLKIGGVGGDTSGEGIVSGLTEFSELTGRAIDIGTTVPPAKIVSIVPGGSAHAHGATSHTDRMREVADDIEKLIRDDDLSCNETGPLQSDSQIHKSSTDESIAEKIGENSLEGGGNEMWYYRDPQGKVQGPFTATEMLEWYRAGYFDENLYVKRVCDPQFLALGDLLKLCSGAIPFVSMPYLPQLLQTNPNDIIVPPKPVANHLAHAAAALPVQLPPNPPVPPENPLLDEPMHHIHPMVSMFMNSQTATAQKFPQLEQTHLMNPQAMAINSLTETEPWALLNPEQQAALIAQRMHPNRGDRDRIVDERGGVDERRQMPLPVNMLHPAATDPVQQMLHTISDTIDSDHHSNARHTRNFNPPGIVDISQRQRHFGFWPMAPQKFRFMDGANEIPDVEPPHLNQPHLGFNAANTNTSYSAYTTYSQHLNFNANASSNPPYAEYSGYPTNNNNSNHNHRVPPVQQQQQQQQQPPPPPPSLQQMQGPIIVHDLQQSMSSGLIHQNEMFKIRNEEQQHIMADPNKPIMVENPNARNLIKSEAKHNIPSDCDLRNNNSAVVNKAHEKQIADEENDGKGSQSTKNIPVASVAPKQMSNEMNQNQNVVLNNNNTQQQQQTPSQHLHQHQPQQPQPHLQHQQNGFHENNHATISNNNDATIKPNASNAAAGKATKEINPRENSTKKKKEQRMAEEKKRQQEEEERQLMEEKKRLETIALQRKAKLVDQNAGSTRGDGNSKRNNMVASIAPWSNIGDVATTNVTSSSLNFADIQKAERERRAEMYRMEQSLREQQTQAILEQQQQQKENVLKWKLKPQSNQIKSLAEIQAEESKARQSNIQQVASSNAQMKSQNVKKDEKWSSATQWGARNDFSWGDGVATTVATGNSNMIMATVNGSANYFWEEASKSAPVPTIAAAKTQSDTLITNKRPASIMQQPASAPTANSSTNSKTVPSAKPTALAKNNSSSNVPNAITATANAGIANKKLKATTSKKAATAQSEDNNDDFSNWCTKTLSAKHGDVIDVPTFVSFLRDIESPFEVKDYIRMYLGETKECIEFAKNFLERRSRYKNQQRAANAHIDDMCSPAPAITPAADGQETKRKGKKEKKKNKMMKLDSRILGFSVTSAEDRLNVGARDYARDAP